MTVARNSAIRVVVAVMENPSNVVKPVKPLLPPNPVSLRKEQQHPRVGQRLRHDREINALIFGQRQTSQHQRQQPRHHHNQYQRPGKVLGSPPEPRQFTREKRHKCGQPITPRGLASGTSPWRIRPRRRSWPSESIPAYPIPDRAPPQRWRSTGFCRAKRQHPCRQRQRMGGRQHRKNGNIKTNTPPAAACNLRCAWRFSRQF